ncbi:MAG: transposase [Ktedonobacteraceae bacterium]
MENSGRTGLYSSKKPRGRWGKRYKDNRNWVEYNEQLVVRGEFYLDFDFVRSWKDELKQMNEGKVGRPFLFPDSFMKWQAIWHQLVDYRGLEGIARKLSKYGLIPEYDDYTTIWYRIHKMKPEIAVPDYNDLEIGCDGSGLKTNNAGQYRIYKYGERTRKKHLVVVITADVRHKKLLDIDAHIEGAGPSEPKIGMRHVRRLVREGKRIKKYYADGSFDTNDTFAQLESLDIESAVPVHIDASPSGSDPPRRKAVRAQFCLPTGPGRRKFYDTKKRRKIMQKEWRDRVELGLRWPGTEGIFSSVKRKFGENTVSRKNENLIAEAIQRFWAYDVICGYALQKA